MFSMEIATISQAPIVCGWESLHIHLVITYPQKVEVDAPILQTEKLRLMEGNYINCPNSSTQ